MRDGERGTEPAPMTGERTPLAFATLVRHGGDAQIKSFSSNVM